MSRIAVIAVVALAAAGCGSSTAHNASTTSTNSWVAFSGCMRSNGVPRYPDPDTTGKPPKRSAQQLGVSSAALTAGQSSCRRYLPNGGRPPSRSQQQLVVTQGLSFARCVRSHGVPNFPDPASDGRIPDPASVGIDQGSPKFQAANEACAKYRPPYMPSNAAYNDYARSHGR